MFGKNSRIVLVGLVIGTGAVLCAAIQLGWSQPAVNDPVFHKQLLQIAAEYQTYGKVDDMSRWAPWLCGPPPPPKARQSMSGDESTHGKKVYFLFAKNRDSYVKFEPGDVGQVIVKESWLPDATDGVDPNSRTAPKPVTQTDLFIMFRTDPKTANTDEGWVYGTVTSDGKMVTSAGRVASCMGCHVSAPHGRLFGIKELIQK